MNGSKIALALSTAVLLLLPSSVAAAHDPIFVVTPSENGLKPLNLFAGPVETVDENSPIMLLNRSGGVVENATLEVFAWGENGFSPVELRTSGGFHLLSHPGFLVGRVSAPGRPETGFAVMVEERKTRGVRAAEFGSIRAEKTPEVGEVATFRALSEEGKNMGDVEIVVEDPDGEYERQEGPSPLSAYVTSKDFSVAALRGGRLGIRRFDLEGEGGGREFSLFATVALVGLAAAVLAGIVYGKKASIPDKSDVPWGWIIIIITGAIAVWLLI